MRRLLFYYFFFPLPSTSFTKELTRNGQNPHTVIFPHFPISILEKKKKDLSFWRDVYYVTNMTVYKSSELLTLRYMF